MAEIIQVNRGVDMSRLQPEIWRICYNVADIFEEFGFPCVITSAYRPKRPRSLHHGYAVDMRANHIESETTQQSILWRIKQAVGNDYDVILHGEGANIHYHIEYDPD